MSTLVADNLKGKTTANTMTVLAGHATDSTQTTNLEQGLAKAFTDFDPSTNTENDSFNQASRSDEGTGFSKLNFTNNMNSDDFSAHHQCSRVIAPTTGTGAYISSTYAQATDSVKLAYGFSGNNTGTTWSFFDYESQKTVVHGDLA